MYVTAALLALSALVALVRYKFGALKVLLACAAAGWLVQAGWPAH